MCSEQNVLYVYLMRKIFEPENKMMQEEFPCSERRPQRSKGQNSFSELIQIITSNEARIRC